MLPYGKVNQPHVYYSLFIAISPKAPNPLRVGSKQNSFECREEETREQNQGSGRKEAEKKSEYVMGRRISQACRGFVASKLKY